MVNLTTGIILSSSEILGVYAVVLIVAGVMNTFSEHLLTKLCSISVFWQICGCIIIVAMMIQYTPNGLQTGGDVVQRYY
jgi:ABC-type phosphate transport system permease subunit